MIYAKIEDLIGKTFEKVYLSPDKETMVFSGPDGTWEFFHPQSCCEWVSVEDVNGELDDLRGSPILQAEESSSQGPSEHESSTWTFYRFGTLKGRVVVRWLGVSNGYYSESVDLRKVDPS